MRRNRENTSIQKSELLSKKQKASLIIKTNRYKKEKEKNPESPPQLSSSMMNLGKNKKSPGKKTDLGKQGFASFRADDLENSPNEKLVKTDNILKDIEILPQMLDSDEDLLAGLEEGESKIFNTYGLNTTKVEFVGNLVNGC